MRKYSISITAIVFSMVLLVTGCQTWDNFITYFNTYYNAERLRKEAEDEFEFQEEKIRITPRVFVPEPKFNIKDKLDKGVPPFLTEFIITRQQRQPVDIKLDSIIIKGSKILAKHPKSDYVEGTLYLMALAYFYQNIWLNSQIKCSELIDKFPEGDKSPDAHLLMSLNLLIQRKYHAGGVLLSRTVDVAWLLERYDILSEAFRIQAALAIFHDDLEGAVRPYRQAIAQTDDNEMKAKWQVEMAAILYRMGQFEKSAVAFKKVDEYSPDYLAEFEAQLYYAASIAKLGRFDEAGEILDDLMDDGKYEEWQSYVYAEQMTILRLQDKLKEFEAAEAHVDTAYVGSPAFMSTYFQKAVQDFNEYHYSSARKYFSRSRSQRTHIKDQATHLYKLLNKWEKKRAQALPVLQRYDKGEELNDSLRLALAGHLFELARVHDQLDNQDSCIHYFKLSTKISPRLDDRSARYIYAFSRYLEPIEPVMADSLMELVIYRYPMTVYAHDAMERIGYDPSTFPKDSALQVFESGDSMRKEKLYTRAFGNFMQIYYKWPLSELAPRGLYAIGWTYEREIKNYDSAYYYYNLLIQSYPKSEYAKDVMLSINYLAAVNSGEPIPDSLKHIIRKPKLDPGKNLRDKLNQNRNRPKLPSNNRKPRGSNPMDFFSNPGEMLDKAKDAIMDAPGDIMDNAKDQIKKTTDLDSLKNQLTPDLKIPEIPTLDETKDSTDSKGKSPEEKNTEKK